MAIKNGNTIPLQGMDLPEIVINTNESGIVRVEEVKRIECVGQIALFGEGSIPTERHLSSVN